MNSPLYVIVASLLIQGNVINILVGVKTIRLTRYFVNLPTPRGLLVIETRGWALDRQWKEATIQILKFYITQSTIHTTHKYKQKTLLSWTIGHRQLSPEAGQVSQGCSDHEWNVNTLINEKQATLDLSLPSYHTNYFHLWYIFILFLLWSSYPWLRKHPFQMFLQGSNISSEVRHLN